MFWGNKRTKVAHYQQCRFAGSKADPNWIPFMTIDDVRAAGYKLCGICSPLAKDYRRFQNEYQDVCQRESFSLYIENGELYVVTPISMWHVRPGRNRKYELLHRNTFGKKDKYHLQRTFSQNVHNVLDYIVRHEKYRYNHPLIESHGVSRGKKRHPHHHQNPHAPSGTGPKCALCCQPDLYLKVHESETT